MVSLWNVKASARFTITKTSDQNENTIKLIDSSKEPYAPFINNCQSKGLEKPANVLRRVIPQSDNVLILVISFIVCL